MKHSYLFMAPGFEEIEAVTPLDVMRRAGMDVKSVSVTDERTVTGANGITVTTDLTIAEIDTEGIDWLICPGGMPGASNLAECDKLMELLATHNSAEGHIAAICAAPAVVLEAAGVLNGRRVTCYPGFENLIKDGDVSADPVVVDGNIVTAKGPAMALRFALAIVTESLGEISANDIAVGMQFHARPKRY